MSCLSIQQHTTTLKSPNINNGYDITFNFMTKRQKAHFRDLLTCSSIEPIAGLACLLLCRNGSVSKSHISLLPECFTLAEEY